MWVLLVVKTLKRLVICRCADEIELLDIWLLPDPEIWFPACETISGGGEGQSVHLHVHEFSLIPLQQLWTLGDSGRILSSLFFQNLAYYKGS